MANGRTYGAFSGGAGSDAYDVMQMAKQGGQKLLLEEDIFSFNALMKAYERQQAKRSSSMGLTQLISTIAVPALMTAMGIPAAASLGGKAMQGIATGGIIDMITKGTAPSKGTMPTFTASGEGPYGRRDRMRAKKMADSQINDLIAAVEAQEKGSTQTSYMLGSMDILGDLLDKIGLGGLGKGGGQGASNPYKEVTTYGG